MGLGSTKKAIIELDFGKVYKSLSENENLKNTIIRLDKAKINSSDISNDVIDAVKEDDSFKDYIKNYNVIESERRIIAISFLIKAKAVLEIENKIDAFINENELDENQVSTMKKSIISGNEDYFRKCLKEDTKEANFSLKAMSEIYSYEIPNDSVHSDEEKYTENDALAEEISEIIEEARENLLNGFDEDEMDYFSDLDEFEENPELYKGLEDEENYFNEREIGSNPYDEFRVMDIKNFDPEYPKESFKKDDSDEMYNGIILKDSELVYAIESDEIDDSFEDINGFTTGQEIKYGWREKGSKYSKSDIINQNQEESKNKEEDLELIYDSDSDKAKAATNRSKALGTLKIGKNDRDVTPTMIYDSIVELGSACGEYRGEKIFENLISIRNRFLDGIFGKGNPVAAYKCFRSVEAEKENIIQYDYKKIKEIQKATSIKGLAKATIEISSKLEPSNDFMNNYRVFTDENPDAREEVELSNKQMNVLVNSLRVMKEIRSTRGAFYWLRHPIDNIIEWRNIKNAEEILNEKGVNPELYQPKLSVDNLVERYENSLVRTNEASEKDRIAIEVDEIFEENDIEKNMVLDEQLSREIEVNPDLKKD